jgi:histidinol dehydrogenase
MEYLEYPIREQWSRFLSRPKEDGAKMDQLLSEIFEAVATEGDVAIVRYSSKFDRNAIGKLILSSRELLTFSTSLLKNFT